MSKLDHKIPAPPSFSEKRLVANFDSKIAKNSIEKQNKEKVKKAEKKIKKVKKKANKELKKKKKELSKLKKKIQKKKKKLEKKKAEFKPRKVHKHYERMRSHTERARYRRMGREYLHGKKVYVKVGQKRVRGHQTKYKTSNVPQGQFNLLDYIHKQYPV